MVATCHRGVQTPRIRYRLRYRGSPFFFSLSVLVPHSPSSMPLSFLPLQRGAAEEFFISHLHFAAHGPFQSFSRCATAILSAAAAVTGFKRCSLARSLAGRPAGRTFILFFINFLFSIFHFPFSFSITAGVVVVVLSCDCLDEEEHLRKIPNLSTQPSSLAHFSLFSSRE